MTPILIKNRSKIVPKSIKNRFGDPPNQGSKKTSKKERFSIDFGPRFCIQNSPESDYVFCCFWDTLKKRSSDDFDLQNDSQMRPLSTTFRKQPNMRFCCYLLYFRTILHLRMCQKSDLISMRVRTSSFLRFRLDFEHFWGSLFDPFSSLFWGCGSGAVDQWFWSCGSVDLEGVVL